MQLDAETRARRWSSLQDKAAKLQAKASLGDAMEAIGDMEAKVRGLADKRHTLRGSGYRYGQTVEARAQQIADDWPAIRSQADAALSRARASLSSLDADIARALSQGRRAATAEDFDAADDALERTENRIEKAARDVTGMFDDFSGRVNAVNRELDHLIWATEAWAAASFAPYPDEALVDAAKAQWITRGDDEGPKGVLFLSDSRLIMEQKEKVATKKVLFIATKKKLVQEMQFAAPIGAVEIQEASDERKGFLGLSKREMLKLRFTTPTEGKRIDSATLRLLGGADNEAWAARIKQVQRGDLAAEAAPVQASSTSAETAAAETAAPAREIPTHCPSCGALLTQPIVKGMQELRCEYCGAVIRL